MPNRSMRPPKASIAAGMTSLRSVIAEAPKTMTRSAACASRASAATSGSISWGVVSWATIWAPVGARRASSARRVFATTLSLRPGRTVETTATRNGRKGATVTPDASPRAASAASSVPSDVANGMILTVATMSPSSTARCSGKVATVIASSTALSRSIAAASMMASPAASANRLTRPVNGAAQRTCAPAKRFASRRAASFSPTSPPSRRAAMTRFTPACASMRRRSGVTRSPFLRAIPSVRTAWARITPSASSTDTGPNFILRGFPSAAASCAARPRSRR